MHNLIIKLFDFLKSLAQFIKILLIFAIMLMLLYWIQNLTGAKWGWMGFISPMLDTFLNIGNTISDGSIELFDAVFEFKYAIACVLFIMLYAIDHFVYIGLEILQEGYESSRQIIKKTEEAAFNASMKAKETNEQKKLQKYQIYVGTKIKKKYQHKEFNINQEEQNRIMNKFLIEKTGITPVRMQDGFLYSFNSFDHIDEILVTFFKLIKSDTPLNYIICVQVLNWENAGKAVLFNKLIDLQLENKICMTSDTAYRYKFNASHRYGISQIGLFQKEQDTFEVSEFIELN